MIKSHFLFYGIIFNVFVVRCLVFSSNFKLTDIDLNNQIKDDLIEVNTLYNQTQFGEYFYNLDEYFPVNEFGSCSYVAMTMVLSYFDTYYSDNLVDDIMIETSSINNLSGNDFKSPGVHKNISNMNNMSDYLSYLSERDTYDLHAHLINLGVSKGYHNGSVDLGLSLSEIANVLNSYLEERNMGNEFYVLCVENYSGSQIINGMYNA